MKKCELLAPAGAKKQYIAAVENGADAVYLGGLRLNARMGAGNFDLPELAAALDYGHLRGVKTYVTMNTLVSDGEVLPAVEYAKQLYRMGVDALIIQDIGLGAAVRDALPDMVLHLSTQATVYNRRGVLAAAKLGYERVVLARETGFEEMKACSETGVETEVFVHGALCFCYSGQCHMSRSIGAGGRSANKGTCAQPCRLPYEYESYGGRLGEGRRGRCGSHTEGGFEETLYPLSPKDLWAVDDLGSYVAAGVSSLKIEGRMKSPEYVATVVRIYRKYLDMARAGEAYKVDLADRLELLQIFNRGGFTEGYGKGDPGKALLTSDVPKHRGVLVGTVLDCVPIGAKKKGRGFLVRVRPERVGVSGASMDGSDAEESCTCGSAAEASCTCGSAAEESCTCGSAAEESCTCGAGFEQGDIFEIRREAGGRAAGSVGGRSGGTDDAEDERNSGMVTLIKPQKDGTFLLGDVKTRAAKGERIYRLSSAAQQKRARESFDNTDFGGGRSGRRSEISMDFTACVGGEMKLCAKHIQTGERVEMSLLDFVVEAAQNRGTSEADVAGQLAKTGDTPFFAAEKGVRVRLVGDCFIPLSKVNALRRDVLRTLEEQIAGSFRRAEPAGKEPTAASVGMGVTEVKGGSSVEAEGCGAGALRCGCAPEVGRVELCFADLGDVTAKTVSGLLNRLAGAGAGHRQIWVLAPLGQLLGGGDEGVKRLFEELDEGVGRGSSMASGGQVKAVPYLESISKGRLDALLESDFGRAAETVRRLGGAVYVGNLGWIEAFAQAGIEVLGDVGLNISNGWALGRMADGLKNYSFLGAAGGIFCLEANRSVYGQIPLMVTEHEMGEGNLLDRKGAKYRVRTLPASGKTMIQPVLSSGQWKVLWGQIGTELRGEGTDGDERDGGRGEGVCGRETAGGAQRVLRIYV